MTNLKSILLMDLSELIFRLTITCEVAYDQRRMPAVARSMNERRMQTPSSPETIEHTENCELGVCVPIQTFFDTDVDDSFNTCVCIHVCTGELVVSATVWDMREKRTE
jgi:hypothetical protein